MEGKRQRKFLLLNMLAAALIISLVMFVVESTGASNTKNYSELGKGIDLFNKVYSHVLDYYVTDKDPTELSKSAINGIMDDLDPYSAFMDKSEFQQLTDDTKGKFGGLGIEISTINDYPRVMSYPMDDMPALKAGIRAGDEIIEINGTSTAKMPISKVVSLLRGDIDTVVKIKIRRGENILPFDIVRKEIPLHNVQYSGVIENGIGYIKLTRFNQDASEEVDKAIKELEAKKVKGIIFDLRFNPGGLLVAAQEVANKFLPKDELIVFTRERSGAEKKLNALNPAQMPTIPLVVLINRGSASASEIVAGAIQDHDRGVLIGETSFGKGSVQTIYNDLPGGNGLKITTAKYYTPSGRCIHKERTLDQLYQEEENDDGDFIQPSPSDSLTKAEKFYTDNKRVVYGGGGINPDIIIKEKPIGNMVAQLLSQSTFFDFAVVYIAKHPDLKLGFEVDEQLLEEFKNYISNDKAFKYSIPGKTNLVNFKKQVELEDYDKDVLVQIDNIEKTLIANRDKDFNANKETLKRILKREITAAKFGSAERTVASKEWDIQLNKAIEILKDEKAYKAILSPGTETGVKH